MHLLLFILYVLTLLSVVFLERKNPHEALLWLVILIFLPFVGLVLYMVFGSTVGIKITGLIRRCKLNSEDRQFLVKELDRYKDTCLQYVGDEDEYLSSIVRFNRNYNDSPLSIHNHIVPLISGKAHYERLFEDIYGAKSSIHVLFYTIHNDSVGNALVEALAEKAREGVQVRVMADFLANVSSSSKMFAPLTQAGGLVKKVKPYLTHFRSHRKIVVVDGYIGYIGGMNIGKQYANQHKVKSPWRDTQIRITGDAVALLQYYFLSDWICAASLKELKSFSFHEQALFPAPAPAPVTPVQFVAGGVDSEREKIKMCYMKLITSAKKSIRIQSPYFIPDSDILNALKMAAASDVSIELMIPGVKASFFLDPVTNYYVDQMLDYHIEVYKYNGYIHAKTMIIDDEITCIGSVNMDIRSLLVDDEICGLIYSRDFTESYDAIYTEDIESCHRLDVEAFRKRGVKERILERVFGLFAPLM